jgi:RND family efflux transporter MFP subunit
MCGKPDIAGRHVKALPGAVVAVVFGFAASVSLADDKAPGSAGAFEGVVRAARVADITPRYDGLLLSLNFKAGDIVDQGQLLVQFQTDQQDYQLEIDKADVAQAASELQLAEADLDRNQKLSSRDVVSEARLQEFTSKRDVAAAKLKAATARVGMMEFIIGQFSLRAPFDGIISAPLVNEGAYVTIEASVVSPIATVTQLDPINVVIEVPYDVYVRQLAALGSQDPVGDRLEVSLVLPDGAEYAHTGKIVSDAFAFDETSQKIQSIAEFPNPDHLLRPGLHVSVRTGAQPAPK